MLSAQGFLDAIYGEPAGGSRAPSRAATPMRVPSHSLHIPGAFPPSSHEKHDRVRGKVPYPSAPRPSGPAQSPKSIRLVRSPSPSVMIPRAQVAAATPSYMQSTRTFLTKHIVAQKATNLFSQGESIPPSTRRLPLPRTSVLPSSPSIADIAIDCDPNAEYAVVISMYEVYNDRIFDLLTPATRAANSKETRRRPLLFKPTEGSAERKVVAGLRKVICGSAKEALLVLEAGLHERRVAGTGSNSVSSRSHGFFCVEVKKRRQSGGRGEWRGSVLTIVDLAGSERARDARTQGATLAEAGKINESLMYLGQCLQMQSDAGSSTKVRFSFPLSSHLPSLQQTSTANITAKQPNLVPYRQCKLTELLFSNSFPTTTSTTSSPPRPQRATMIVTADPLGDFAATSQILRYSALAREITVPRIPSISATILGARGHSSGSQQGSGAGGDRETMEVAALEIARLSEEVEALRSELGAERAAREDAQARLVSAGDRAAEAEQAVREEVWAEMEGRLEAEGRMWKARWEEERERGGEHLDRKLEVLVRGLDLGEGDKENSRPEGGGGSAARESELEEENRQLRAMLKRMRGAEGQRSPSRLRTVLGEARGFEQHSHSHHQQQQQQQMGLDASDGRMQMRGMGVLEAGRERASSSSPVKRVRKLGARRWDLGEEEML